jgi:hypothetical protein|nr:MAG TPA: hypothetical protein [Caudoviricetes sp.]
MLLSKHSKRNPRGIWLISALRAARKHFPKCDPYVKNGEIYLKPKEGLPMLQVLGLPDALMKALQDSQ